MPKIGVLRKADNCKTACSQNSIDGCLHVMGFSLGLRAIQTTGCVVLGLHIFLVLPYLSTQNDSSCIPSSSLLLPSRVVWGLGTTGCGHFEATGCWYNSFSIILLRKVDCAVTVMSVG